MSTNQKEIEEIENQIAELKQKGVTKLDNRIEMRKLVKRLDMLNSPVKSSQVFVSEEDQKDSTISFIPIALIKNANNEPIEDELKDRTEIDREKIESLARSIKKIGLMQPVVLHAMEDGSYRKIAGMRRIEATKILGEEKIRAIIKYGDFDLHTHNLSILHENTQRENLNPYDRLMAVFHFVKGDLGAESYDEAKKMAIQANNHKKGSVVNPEDHQAHLDTIEGVLKETAVFGSLSQFVKHLAILDMDEEIIALLNANRLSFKTAEKLHRLRKAKWEGGWTYPFVIQHVGEQALSLREIEEFAKENVMSKKPEASVDKILNVFNSVKSKVKTLDESKRMALENELQILHGKYFSE